MFSFIPVLFFFAEAALAFNTSINIRQYGDCNEEIRSFGKGLPAEFIEPHHFLNISELYYNEAESYEKLRAKFYFRGFSDFSIALSSTKNSSSTPFFQTIMSYKNYYSAIFTERVITTGITPFCNKIKRAERFLSTVYYEEFLLVVTKDGVMSWYLSSSEEPFLQCKDPALKNVQYISFSGYDSRDTDVYYADCPI